MAQDSSTSEFRYWAFISYSHADESWARWLHRALETYRLPKHLESARGELPKRLFPIFRDTDELPGSSNLGAKLEEALHQSRSLIVLCSPEAAHSKWVDQEIRTFQESGRGDRIFSVIVGGEPNAADPAMECFPESLRRGDIEPLACDPRPDRDGKTNSKLRLIAGILGLSFDDLKQRDRQRKIRRRIGLSLAGVVLALVLGAISIVALRQSDIAQSRSLATESLELVEQDPVEALRLAVEAAGLASTTESSNALSKALTRQLTKSILIHSSRVTHAGFSPLQTVLTCTEDGSAVVWDPLKAGPQTVIKDESEGQGSGLYICTFSPDGTLVLTSGGGLPARLWNSQTGRMTSVLGGFDGEVLAADFSPDGSKVLTAGEDGTARIWDTETGQQLLAYQEHDTPISAAFFFPDNRRVVTIGSEGRAFTWNSATGTTIANFGDFIPVLGDAALAPNGSRLLISNYQYSAVLWEPNSGELIKSLTTRSLGAAFSRDSSLLVTGSGDGQVSVWQADDGIRVKELFHDDIVSSVLFSPDGELVLTSEDGGPALWDTPALGGGAESSIFSLRGHRGYARPAGFSDDGKFLLTIGDDNTVRIWDIYQGPYLRSFSQPRLGAVIFSPDGSRIATVGDEVQIWSRNWTPVSTFGPVYLTEGQFSRDGARFINRCQRRAVCVFDSASGSLLRKIEIQGLGFAISPDGSRVAVVGQGHTMILHDVASGDKIAAFERRRDPSSLLFSPDGLQILALEEGNEQVLDIESGRQMWALEGYGATFSPDGSTIATRSRGIIRLFQSSSGRLLQELDQQSGEITVVTFSADSSQIAAATSDGLIMIWDVRSGKKMQTLSPGSGHVRSLRFTGGGGLTVLAASGLHCYDLRIGSELVLRDNFGMSNSALNPDGNTAVAVNSPRGLIYSCDPEELFRMAPSRMPAVGSYQ